MKSFLKIIKTTLLGGVFFLVPLILLIVLLEKGYVILQKITLPLVSHLPRIKVLGLALEELAGIIILVFICLIAGLFSRSTRARKVIQKLEDSVLSFVPGYSFMKKTNENIMGLESNEDLKVVLVPTDAGLQFAFVVEQINENNFAVFVPDAPNPWSGSVCFVEKKDIKEIEITQKEALACIRKLGYGSKELLKNKL